MGKKEARFASLLNTSWPPDVGNILIPLKKGISIDLKSMFFCVKGVWLMNQGPLRNPILGNIFLELYKKIYLILKSKKIVSILVVLISY